MIFNKKRIEVKNGIIPYDEIKNEKNITFIIITDDMEVLEASINAIAKEYEKDTSRTFNVVISRSYNKIKDIM